MILSGSLAEEKRVHLTIFWRVIFAQLTLIALILGMSLYALFQLHHLADLSTALLDTDSKSIEEEKHLLKIFLSQRRIAELVQLNGKIFLFYNKSLDDLNVEKFTHKHPRSVDGVNDVWHAYPNPPRIIPD